MTYISIEYKGNMLNFKVFRLFLGQIPSLPTYNTLQIHPDFVLARLPPPMC